VVKREKGVVLTEKGEKLREKIERFAGFLRNI